MEQEEVAAGSATEQAFGSVATGVDGNVAAWDEAAETIETGEATMAEADAALAASTLSLAEAEMAASKILAGAEAAAATVEASTIMGAAELEVQGNTADTKWLADTQKEAMESASQTLADALGDAHLDAVTTMANTHADGMVEGSELVKAAMIEGAGAMQVAITSGAEAHAEGILDSAQTLQDAVQQGADTHRTGMEDSAAMLQQAVETGAQTHFNGLTEGATAMGSAIDTAADTQKDGLTQSAHIMGCYALVITFIILGLGLVYLGWLILRWFRERKLAKEELELEERECDHKHEVEMVRLQLQQQRLQLEMQRAGLHGPAMAEGVSVDGGVHEVPNVSPEAEESFPHLVLERDVSTRSLCAQHIHEQCYDKDDDGDSDIEGHDQYYSVYNWGAAGMDLYPDLHAAAAKSPHHSDGTHNAGGASVVAASEHSLSDDEDLFISDHSTVSSDADNSTSANATGFGCRFAMQRKNTLVRERSVRS